MRFVARMGVLLALIVAWPALGHSQQQPVDVWIMQSDPSLTAPLGRGESLYVRLGYRSDRPVRFRMEGYAGGVNVTAGAMYNGAPPRPAGEGEALVWLAYRQPVRIDEIRITALDANWKPLHTFATPVDMAWTAEGGSRQPVPWVARMNGEQQEAIRQQIEQREGGGGGGALVFFLLLGGVLGYFVLQPLTVLWFAGRWRLAALAPLLATVPLIVHAAIAFAAGGNLWPLLLIFCLPVATLYLLALAGIHSLAADAAAT